MLATVTNSAAHPPTIKPDSLKHIDVSSLSQSELLAISSCSSSAFDLRRSDDVVIPQIDRSVFNESTGSRRQTYSRPRASTAPQSSSATGHHHRQRVAGLLPGPKLPPIPDDDPERVENKFIISHLKQFLSDNPKFDCIDFSSLPPPPPLSIAPITNSDSVIDARKRKRGRKPKPKVNLADGNVNLEIRNRNGVAVDVELLARMEDPYGEELRRRTAGMETEDALLGFLRDLGGQWGSRRKRRKIVDASELGDALPLGWKLLLGLKRREFRASVYCRRYISPSGRHFVSCKEVASYLHSIFQHKDAQQSGGRGANSQQDLTTASESHAGLLSREGEREDVNARTTIPAITPSNENDKDDSLFGIENLAEVQIHDLFECRKCDMNFDEKDAYLQHLLSFHQRTTRRYRLGSSVGDGVIMRDGKFECQFCHKVFLERRRYNGHVGIHVRNFVRGVGETPTRRSIHKQSESSSRDELPSRIARMDALIEIAQNSFLETSAVGPNQEPNGDLFGEKPTSSQAIPNVNYGHEMSSDSSLSEAEADDCMIERDVDKNLNQKKIEAIIDENMEEIGNASDVAAIKLDTSMDGTDATSNEGQMDVTSETLSEKKIEALANDQNNKPGTGQEKDSEGNFITVSEEEVSIEIGDIEKLVKTNSAEKPKPDEMNNKNRELSFGIVCNNGGPTHDLMTESIQHTPENNMIDSINPDAVLQDSNVKLDSASHEDHDGICDDNQRHDNITTLEELGLDDIDNLKFSFGGGQESNSVPQVSVDLGNDAQMEERRTSQDQFESERARVELDGKHHLTTPCVWCGVEFNHESFDSEVQSDSVGYMCPSCKSRISGQINALDSGSPMNSNHL